MLTVTNLLLALLATILVVSPLFVMFTKGNKTNYARQKLIGQIALFSGVFLVTIITQIGGFKASAETTAATLQTGMSIGTGLGYLGAALSTGLSALGAGVAVGGAAPAAIGAISENEDNFGRALLFVALGEGVAIYGLLISILIINAL